MSTKLTGYVWDACASSGMKLSSVAIMARLADFSNDEGVCWPSIATISRQIGAGESTVRTAITALEKEDGSPVRNAATATVMHRTSTSSTFPNYRKRHFLTCQFLTRQNLTHQNLNRQNLMRQKLTPQNLRRRNPPTKPVLTRQNLGDPSVKSTTDPSDINPSCPDASQPDERGSADEFLSRHPDAVVYSAAKRQWGSQDDLTCAEFIWGKIISMYELAAESDGEVVRPKEPNWTAWANEVRLMVMQDGEPINKFAHFSNAPTKIRSGAKTCLARRNFGKNGMSCR